jgi:uncharacterized protein YybS (DUF2232 family)
LDFSGRTISVSMKVSDILGCTALAAFFLLASAWIPFVGPFLCLLAPLPFLYYATKLGFSQGVKLAALSVLTIGLAAKLAGQTQVILFAVEFSLLGLLLSKLYDRNLGIGRTILIATAFLLLLGFGFLFFVALSKNMGPFEMVLSYLGAHLKATLKSYEEMGIPPENVLEFEAYTKAFVDIISRIYPSLVIIGTGFAVWLNVVLSRHLFQMKNVKYPDFAPMTHWQAPEVLVWGVIISGFALFLSSGTVQFLSINLLIILMAIYFFHGLSILVFFLNKYRVPSWIRIGIYVLVTIQQLFMAVLALAGLFDQWVDFRKIHRRMKS